MMVASARRLAVATAFLCLLSGSAIAQTPTPAQIAVAREVVEFSGVADTMGDAVKLFVDEGKRTFLNTNPNLSRELDQAGEALVVQLRPRQDELMNDVAAAYARRFSLEELQQVAAFYKTPTGRKFREGQPIAQREAFDSFRDWSDRMSQEVVTRLRAEMKKRGHDI